ncbi:hypothetical protein RDV78_05110 [Bacillota bacterium LX-D]|nr:hypothetical protein [Bacillota bacterium LX-D]
MAKTGKKSYGNLYFLNNEAQYYYLDNFVNEKLNEIEISTADDFNEQFEDWAKDHPTNELFLIWAVLNELQNDSENLQDLIEFQCSAYQIPEWLALNGTLAFFSVHFLNKYLLEIELQKRQVRFDAYTTDQETVIFADNKIFKFSRSFLKSLKENIYQDQLDKNYFSELAQAITSITLH